ncbi:sensor histidine kinase [Dactylosporangium salmoneum]|uniref:Histidine kinase domain-containing protein n=1 Tax=Dactylosporangium salmoneum TaxID=53361 RepID=A0ABP5SSA0_9ACTN
MTRERASAVAAWVSAAAGVALLAAAFLLELSGISARGELWTAAGAGGAFLLSLAILPAAGAHRFAVRARLLTAVGVSALIAVAALWQGSVKPDPSVLLLLIPVALLFATAGLALREASVEGRRSRLHQIRSRLDGAEAERRRWARELHDDTLQELAAAHVLLAAAAAAPDPAARSAGIADAREIVGRQIQSLRRLIAQMRPLALDALGLAAALEDLARHAHDRDGVEVEAEVEGLARLPAATETAVYRIVQEALTNALRHARAARIRIETGALGEGLRVVVRDDGAGPPPEGFTAGHGLRGMRERAELLGAALHVGPAALGGTQVTLDLPAQAM